MTPLGRDWEREFLGAVEDDGAPAPRQQGNAWKLAPASLAA